VIATPAGGGAFTTQGVDSEALLLVIDQDSIGTGGAPNFFTAADVNDDIAALGRRSELRFFDAHEDEAITLYTGQVGDEGWFALTTIPAAWDNTGPVVGDGLRNYVGNPSLPYPHDVGPGLGTGNDPEALLDKVPGVTPLRAAGLRALTGKMACAVVYDGDVSINYRPLNGSLKGASLGTIAFEVTNMTARAGDTSSLSLPAVEVKILDADDVCERDLVLAGDVSSAGGLAVSADGSASVAVPEGAVTGDDVVVTIEPTADVPPADFGDAVSTVYDFGPDGLVFAKPVLLTFSYDPAALPRNSDPSELRIAFETAGVWLGLPTTVDTAAHTATAAIFHFTRFCVCRPDRSLRTAPGSVTNLAATQDGAAIVLSWTPPAENYSYAEVRRGANASGPFTVFGYSDPGATTFRDESPLAGTSCYEVRAVNQGGFLSIPQGICIEVRVLAVPIAAGALHTCALTTAGGVKCWGDNSSGQLGDGSGTDRLTPVDVSTLTSGVAEVAAAEDHTCALTIGGGVKCWGANHQGQLGDGTTADRVTPVNVTGLTSGVTAIAAGNLYSCALTTGGGVKCWGWNQQGQLGDGTTTTRLTPVGVSGLTSGVVAIATADFAHTCAITTGGGVKCWGDNTYGQLGDGTTTTSLTPVDVSGLTSGVAAIAVGYAHSCALTTAGGVKCWGNNPSGQLGDGTINIDRLTPVDVSGLTSGIAAIAAGAAHTCALTSGGGTKCWGDNTYGQLGDGTTTTRLTPLDVAGWTGGVGNIAAGQVHTCSRTTSGGARCWGRNEHGQLGDGTTMDRLTPVDVVGL
jgi:alpha-tubulin suppressor-like RCC1 family protein